jgi:hypothetical protein
MTMGRFHFTKNTVSASFWCMTCGCPTEHRVDNGRRGPCLGCLARLEPRLPGYSEPDFDQPRLFDTAALPKDVG